MPKIAFLFPGQGAQTVGMAKDLCQANPAARRRFEEAADILGYDLLEVCAQGPADRLNSTAVSQPAIFVASLAALESLRDKEPDVEKDVVAVAGLSLGEYTALVYAGALSFAEGVRLVRRRGEAMQASSDATPSGMVSVLSLPLDKLEEICATVRSSTGLIEVANHLCPGNLVVSGTKEACAEVERLAAEAGAASLDNRLSLVPEPVANPLERPRTAVGRRRAAPLQRPLLVSNLSYASLRFLASMP